MVHSFDDGIDFFDIVAGVLQGQILTPFLFINCQDYVRRTSMDLMKDNSFTKKTKKTITDTHDTDDGRFP